MRGLRSLTAIAIGSAWSRGTYSQESLQVRLKCAFGVVLGNRGDSTRDTESDDDNYRFFLECPASVQ
jgi:hypothetical protein